MRLFGVSHIHFIGCGGAGMAPLAMILHQKGFSVSGSDMAASVNTDKLLSSGIDVSIGHASANIPNSDYIAVYSSAVAEDNPELVVAKSRAVRCLRRGEMLVEIAKTYTRFVAISGSHGKSTVTAMLVHILRESQVDTGFMIGAKVNTWQSSSASGDGDIFIAEVDESDGTHTLANPWLGIVTNVEDDHCWSVGGYEKLLSNFVKFAKNSNKLLYVKDPVSEQLLKFHSNATALDYAKCASSVTIKNWGDYQLVNGATAILAAQNLGVDMDRAHTSLKTFPGVARRMVIHHESEKFVIIEDYAHHPTEVAVVIETFRKLYPHHNLSVVFQPHRYARLERYIDDFATELKLADSVFITPVFAAWAEDGSVDSSDLAMKTGEMAVAHNGTWEELAAELVGQSRGKNLIAILGAGNINMLIPPLLKLIQPSIIGKV